MCRLISVPMSPRALFSCADDKFRQPSPCPLILTRNESPSPLAGFRLRIFECEIYHQHNYYSIQHIKVPRPQSNRRSTRHCDQRPKVVNWAPCTRVQVGVVEPIGNAKVKTELKARFAVTSNNICITSVTLMQPVNHTNF